MGPTFTLYIRKGDVVTAKSDLPTLYKHKDIGFEDFEDSTKYEAGLKDYAVEDMRWYSAGKGLKVFSEIKLRIAAGERFELPPQTIIQVRKELDTAIKDLVQPAKNRLQFHLAWSQ